MSPKPLSAVGTARMLPAAVALAGFLASLLPAVAFAASGALAAALRGADCGSARSAPRPVEALDRAARWWSEGQSLQAALQRSGYRADAVQGLRARGDPRAAQGELRRRACAALRSEALPQLGSFARGTEQWVVLARPYEPPPPASAAAVAARVLQLVNDARARPRRCGEQSLPAAKALRLHSRLSDVAADYARELARRDELTHRGAGGSRPIDRVRAADLAPRRVGENIAAGPASAEEVVAGWLASPGHCLNLMDAGFAELGIGYADAGVNTAGVYWVQVFASFGR